MDNGLVFDYFYGAESEQFSFFRVPKLLITDKRFEDLPNDAKLLYGLLLDRMSLSRKNEWFDAENRAYIIFTVEEVMQDMNCANGKASKLLISLEQIGLIERKKPGLGRPAIIYVKNFMSIFQDEDTHNKQGKPEQDSYQHSSEDAVQHEKEPANPVKSTDVRKSHVKECENRTSRNAEIARQEMRKSHVRECENRTLGDAEIARQDMRKSHANNTNINNTDLNDTDLSHTHSSQTAASENPDYSRPVRLLVEESNGTEGTKDTFISDEYSLYEKRIKKNLFYDYYMNSRMFSSEGKKLFEFMTQRILRMVTDTPEYLMVKDRKIPGELVKSVFLKLRGDHIMYCIEKIAGVTTEIRNPRAYIDAMLYSSYTEYNEKNTIEELKAVGTYPSGNFWT